MEQIEAEAYNYQIKKQNSKIQFITFTDQLKFNETEDFYKAEVFPLNLNVSFLFLRIKQYSFRVFVEQ